MDVVYSQRVTIQQTGVARIAAIGGSAFADNNRDQIGQQVAPRFGVLVVTGSDPVGLRASTIEVQGYYSRTVATARAPVEVITELPASLTLRGPAGLEVLIEAWPLLTSGAERGARQRVYYAGGALIAASVPIWARSFDFSGGAVATFLDDAAAVVGSIGAGYPVTGFSVPPGASTVEIVGGAAATLVFAQKG